jgi:hypothetical protein
MPPGNCGRRAPACWRQAFLVAGLVTGLFLACPEARAVMHEKVCVQQDTINGWSRTHKVKALVLRGLELNEAKKSLQFTPASLYVVLLWDETRTTAIELDAPVLPPLGQEGRDLGGTRWRVWLGRTCI